MDYLTKRPDPVEHHEAVPYDVLLEIVNRLQEVDPEMTVQRLKAFLLVMRYPDLNTQELAKQAGMSKPSMSRNLSALGSWNANTKKAGYGLIEGREFRSDRRHKFYFLTDRGRGVRDALVTILRSHIARLSGINPPS